MSDLLNPRKVASQWSRADLRTELPSGDPAVEGQPYIEPTTGKMEVSRGTHKQINMEAMQSLPAGLFAGYHAIQTDRIRWQLPASGEADGTVTDITDEIVHPSVVAFDRPWHGYKYWAVLTTYPGSAGGKENPTVVATNDDSLATWEEPEGITNPVVPFDIGLNSQADVSMIYDYGRDMLVVYYLSTYTGGRQFRSIESSNGTTWSAYTIRMTHTGTETYGSPCIVTYDDNGVQTSRLVYYRNYRLCWKESTSIHGDISGTWDSIYEHVVPCVLPRNRMLWDFQTYRLSSGEWLLCQTLSNTAITFTECYFGYSTDDLATVQFDPAPKLTPLPASGAAPWATTYIYTTALVARVTNGVPTFQALASAKSTVWGGMAVEFKPRAEFTDLPLLSTRAPMMATPKTGTLTTGRLKRGTFDSLVGWTKTNAVSVSADGFVFSAAQNGWLSDAASGTTGLTDITALVRFRIDKDPATASAGARIGICSVGGIHLAAIRHASGPAWQLEVVTFVGSTPTSRLVAETLPGSWGEFITVGLTKSGDALIYESDTDNDLIASTASFSHTLTNICQIGQPAPAVIGDVTISDLSIWGSSLVQPELARLVRRNGIPSRAKNLVLNSEEIDNATWSKYRLNVTANASGTVDKIVPTAVAGTHATDTPITFRRGIPYAWSVAAKADGYGYIALLANAFGAYFDLNSGTVLGAYFAAPWDATIEALGGGWYRCSIILVPSLGGAGTAGAYVSADGVTTSFTGNGTSGVLIGGCQLAQNEAAPITYHRRLGA